MTAPNEPAPDDALLLEAWRAGDRESGKTLLRRLHRPIERVFRNKVKTDGDCADLVQDTFESLMSANFQGRTSVRSFAQSIAVRKLYNYYRKRATVDRAMTIDFDRYSVVDLGQSPQLALEEKREKRILLEALRSLPVARQVILELHYWSENSQVRVAEILGLSYAAVRLRVRRARAQLEDKIRELSESPESLKSTLTTLDDWARKIRSDIKLDVDDESEG